MKLLNSPYSKWIVLLLFALTGFWGAVVMNQASHNLITATGSDELLDTQLNVSVETIYAYLNKVGNNGRSVLKSIYLFHDFLFPIIYGFFYIMAIAYFINQLSVNKKWMLLTLIPLIMILADFVENFIIVQLINTFPIQNHGLASILGSITLIKWLLGIIAGLVLVTSILLVIIKKIKSRSAHQKS